MIEEICDHYFLNTNDVKSGKIAKSKAYILANSIYPETFRFQVNCRIFVLIYFINIHLNKGSLCR